MRKINYPYYFFLFFILIGFGYFVTFNSLDPDFGWHLKTGELILERGVPKIDWYSFTMPDFPWTDHEWLTDVLIYKIYFSFGFQALLLFFLAIASISFVILIKSENFWFYLLPVVLGFFAIFGFLGIRPQIITVFFIAVLWKILIEFLEGKKLGRLIYFVPLLFIIWANLHGGFFSGLFISFLFIFLESFKKTIFFKKIISLSFFQQQNFKEQPIKKILLLCAILIFSFLATLINPYGIRIYEEIFRTIGDPFLRFHIAEWLPLFLGDYFSVFIVCYLGLFLGLLIPLRKKIEFSKLALVGVFLIFSLLSQRHFFIFTILTIPIFVEILILFQKEIKPERVRILFAGFGKWIILFFIFALLFSGFYPVVKGLLKKDVSPFSVEDSLPFLKTLPLSENLFNDYGWGGYLIWKLPERKVFIDGRMPSWRKDSQFVFGDYVKISKSEEGFQEILDKYDIKIMLLRKEIKENNKLKKELKAENWLSEFLKKQKWLLKVLGLYPSKNLYQELINSGWQTIYENKTVIILRR